MPNLMHHRSVLLPWAKVLGLSLLWACSPSSPGTGSSGTGGAVPSGGVSTTGGARSTGGAPSLSGGARTGGAVPSSGGQYTGGMVATGGRPRNGGGGASGSGGAGTPSGGSIPDGGANAGGGADNGGGSRSGGGATGGAFPGTGGQVGATGGAGGGPRDAAAPDASSTGTGPEPFVFGRPPAAASRFMKGINLGNRLEAPNEGDWGGKVLASDFPFIAKRGFDHVRIPMKFSGHAQTGAPYTIDASFFSRVDTVLDQALAANLAVIIDMHAYDEMATDPSGQRDRFVALWTQIAARYKDRPDAVAFELMNEPNSQLDALWNDFLAAAIAAIRATNPRRLLVVDTVFWADPPKLAALKLPDDANLLVAVHLYEPKLFSMQGKSWMGPEYMTTGIVFPGPPSSPVTPVAAAAAASWAKQWFDDYNKLPAATNPSGPATIAAQMAYITNYQTSEGRTVYNGEWGPQDGGPMDSRARLVMEVRKRCEQAKVGWAIWDDPVNMNLFDSAAGTWVSQIVDALLP